MDKSDKISIHAPHEGERPQGSPFVWSEYDFNPRSPRGGATSTLVNPGMEIDISIHAPHEGERLNVSRDKAKNWRAFQSTLPARGSDFYNQCDCKTSYAISIHAPREGERRQHARGIVRKMKFQSTLPARGSDRQAFVCSLLQPYFNPRSPRGGATSICPQECTPTADFNPRSPRGGATFMPATSAEPTSKFQSTLPARGSDGDWITLELPQGISIHAPREGERRRA